MKTHLENFDLSKYMLHKPPMLLVDKIIEENDKKATTSFAVKQDCIFLGENNILSRPALIEIAAQSFAAADIYQRIKSSKALVKGFLVSIRKFGFTGQARLGDEIICKAEEISEIAGLHIVSAQLWVGGNCIAGGELRIFEISGNAGEMKISV